MKKLTPWIWPCLLVGAEVYTYIRATDYELFFFLWIMASVTLLVNSFIDILGVFGGSGAMGMSAIADPNAASNLRSRSGFLFRDVKTSKRLFYLAMTLTNIGLYILMVKLIFG